MSDDKKPMTLRVQYPGGRAFLFGPVLTSREHHVRNFKDAWRAVSPHEPPRVVSVHEGRLTFQGIPAPGAGMVLE